MKKIEEEWDKIELLRVEDDEKKIEIGITKIEDDLLKLKEEHLKKKESKKIKIRNLVNSLLDLVNEKNEMRLGDAARELNIDKRVLERCSKILENEKIIGIKYPLVGDPILMKEK